MHIISTNISNNNYYSPHMNQQIHTQREDEYSLEQHRIMNNYSFEYRIHSTNVHILYKHSLQSREDEIIEFFFNSI